MRRFLCLVALVVLVILTASCVAGPNSLQNSPNEDGEVAGFWQGLWHGIIAPIMFIVSLFASDLHMYEVHNNGAWYNLGYLFGLAMILGGGSGGAVRRRSSGRTRRVAGDDLER